MTLPFPVYLLHSHVAREGRGLNSKFQTCILLESNCSKSGRPQTHKLEGVKWSEPEISFLWHLTQPTTEPISCLVHYLCLALLLCSGPVLGSFFLFFPIFTFCGRILKYFILKLSHTSTWQPYQPEAQWDPPGISRWILELTWLDSMVWENEKPLVGAESWQSWQGCQFWWSMWEIPFCWLWGPSTT